MKYLKDGWLILLLALVFGSGLTAVQATLGPIIAQNQKDKTYRRIPKLMLGPQATEGKTIEPEGAKVQLLEGDRPVETLRVEETSEDSPVTAYRVFRGQELLGYVVEGSGSGYADRITALIGLGSDLETITGVSVIQQMETPGLGDKITGPWADQFAGKSVEPPLEVVKNGSASAENHRIDAISGATISSRAVTNIVNQTVERFADEKPSLNWKRPEETSDDDR
jgi:electron transport complex protein RnfG